jgi:hypothetical protein
VGAYNSSDAGRAIYAEATAGAGTTYAVRGHVSSPDGYGAYFTGASGSRNYFQHNVGIGVIGATFQLQLGLNSAAKPGGGSWTASSDARLKKNVTTIGGSLDKLLQLRGVSYEWIDPDSQGGMDGSYPGFIAQEVEQVFPEWVGTDAEGFKTLTIFGFEGVAVEALRELRAEKDAEITELKKELAELKELVSALAEQVQAQRFNPK